MSLQGEEIRARTHRGETMLRTQREGGCLQAKLRGLRRNQPCRHLDLRHLTSRIERKELSLVEAAQSKVLRYSSPSGLTQMTLQPHGAPPGLLVCTPAPLVLVLAKGTVLGRTLQSWHCHFKAVWLWSKHLTFLSLSSSSATEDITVSHCCLRTKRAKACK